MTGKEWKKKCEREGKNALIIATHACYVSIWRYAFRNKSKIHLCFLLTRTLTLRNNQLECGFIFEAANLCRCVSSRLFSYFMRALIFRDRESYQRWKSVFAISVHFYFPSRSAIFDRLFLLQKKLVLDSAKLTFFFCYFLPSHFFLRYKFIDLFQSCESDPVTCSVSFNILMQNMNENEDDIFSGMIDPPVRA